MSQREFRRWKATSRPRATDTLSPVRPVSTVAAPIRASTPRNAVAATVQASRPGLVFRRRNARTSSQTPINRATPDSARWENSIQVAMPWSSGRNSPWQRGQSRPHPAPEPVALTTAPCRMTIPLTAKVVQARAAVVTPRAGPLWPARMVWTYKLACRGSVPGIIRTRHYAYKPGSDRRFGAGRWNSVSKGAGFGDAVRTDLGSRSIKPELEFARGFFQRRLDLSMTLSLGNRRLVLSGPRHRVRTAGARRPGAHPDFPPTAGTRSV